MNVKIKIKRGIQYVLLWTVAVIGAFSCSEAPIGQTPTDHVAPSPLVNVQVESIPGGAKFTYDLPEEKDISYVKAEYTYKGVKRILRSSVYNNFLILEGMGTVEPVEVSLFVVDHSENVSAGIKKTFTPGRPPWETIFESVEITPTFGGVSITWNNETATEIGITIFSEENGVMKEGRTIFSKEKNGYVSFRGYDPVELHFAVRITDKWGNESGLKDIKVTPYLERLLDKSKFRAFVLPGDNNTTASNRPFSNMWDGRTDIIWHTLYPADFVFPMYETLDLGVDAVISRIKLWTRPNFWYNNYSWRTFELWASKTCREGMSEPYWTGQEWKNEWIMLGDFEIKRPSGNTAPISTPTGDDLVAAQEGFDFGVQRGSGTVRYLRFVVKTIWAAGAAMHMGELNVYGDDNIE
ncbi:MAG: DUF4959 domain-containing protein [Dysgonamonadaceae bacterium]|nr:DUF4959 domain-containing protein [Dysgonamonadaceae bacterium]